MGAGGVEEGQGGRRGVEEEAEEEVVEEEPLSTSMDGTGEWLVRFQVSEKNYARFLMKNKL